MLFRSTVCRGRLCCMRIGPDPNKKSRSEIPGGFLNVMRPMKSVGLFFCAKRPAVRTIMLAFVRATLLMRGIVFAWVFTVQVSLRAVFVAIRFGRHGFFAAEIKVIPIRITKWPTAHARTKIIDADAFALLLGRRCFFLFGQSSILNGR